MKTKNIFFAYVMTLTSIRVYAQNGEWTLEQFRNEIRSKNTLFKTYDKSREISELKLKTGDLVLTPIFFMSAGYLSDKKQPNQLTANESSAQKYSLGFSKKFSSGTNIKISGDLSEAKNNGIQSPLFSSYEKYSVGSLGLSLSQSLLKDSFGELTSVR
ncbi:MAG: hypothetical protein L6Q37_05220, partial [Bdellovibrionaceae bacterium]|nr:hypothetical protein [Pseudobdellovibrionaceae bacterium]